MADSTTIARTNVVSLAEYRAARAARALPLLDTTTGTSLAPAPAPARPLLPREVEHRARMLRHLAGR
jgi:hypothetical protein